MRFLFFFLMFCMSFGFAQSESETNPPYNIKTIGFYQNNTLVYPFFRLGESFEIRFDDLYGNEADYYYTITQYNYDWTPTNLSKVEYLNGMDNQRIITYENSFNTLQMYSHYVQKFPNKFNSITKSGNYLIKIFNSDNEIVFSKKFIVYEDMLQVASTVRKSRDLETIQQKQNLDFSINLGDKIFQNPKQNIKVSIFQNGRWDNAKHNIVPQYTIGSELIYRYNQETQFWGGNEFLFFENSVVRAPNSSVLKYTSGDIYNTILYPNFSRKHSPYTFFPDVNGFFAVSNRNAENSNIQADYTWVYFSLKNSEEFENKSIYICGMFNNYAKSDEYKLELNKETGYLEKALLLKQGYVNFHYILLQRNNQLDEENAIDGNFFQTENIYNFLVYYRGNNDRYDRVIGNGSTSSTIIRN